MKLVLAIILILMLISLSTGAETSDSRASMSATAETDGLLRVKSSMCKQSNGPCSGNFDCCGNLCCTWDNTCGDKIGGC
uniref:Conotoxin Di11.1 n=1 Tax=Conus distans TaxID=72281 RepID=M9PMZ7_CONDI|nr:conotoxin Di11.1 [Conus distans]